MPQQIIQLELKEFLDILLGSRDKCYPSANIVQQILALDSKEELCHIELLPNNIYECWRISDWRTHYIKVLRDRENSEVERRYSCILRERCDAIAKAIARVLNLTSDAPFIELANQIAKQPNDKIAPILAAYGIDTSKLAEYQTEDSIRIQIRSEKEQDHLLASQAMPQLKNSPSMIAIQNQLKSKV
jgi:hypothetical protein